jgi:hypothetical protein
MWPPAGGEGKRIIDDIAGRVFEWLMVEQSAARQDDTWNLVVGAQPKDGVVSLVDGATAAQPCSMKVLPER